MIQLPPGKQKPWLAVLLSFLLIGGGQLYNRQVLKGFILLGAFITTFVYLLFLVFDAYPNRLPITPWWPYFFEAVPFLLALDAYRIAARLRRGEPVRRWQWF